MGKKLDKNVSRRDFLNLTNKAGVAVILAGGVLDIIRPQNVFSALQQNGDKTFKTLRPRQKKAIVTNQSKQDHIIVSSTLAFKEKKYLLNSEGSFLWNLCNGRHSLEMMTDALALKYKKTPAVVESDINNFVHTLKTLNLIEFLN
ncbi:MAG TPA: PqqD family protein [bacterium]|nr:PqqD family protein [bacterium]HPN43981.1 PqqD family protein [bacterium]